MRALYSLALWIAQPFLRRKLAKRSVDEPGYGVAVEERFGRYTSAPVSGQELIVWVHAVSLGETRTAALLIAGLRERLPGMRLLLTHGTATGRAEGTTLLKTGDMQVWQPWDTPGAVQRFLTHFKPSLCILMETEVWPNLVALSQQNGVPLVLANARMSEKSRRQAARLGWLSRPAMAALSAVWAQTEADADRLRQLGATVQGVFGNLKFDAAPDAAKLATGRAWRARTASPVALFTSSREGEEIVWLKALRDSTPFRASAQAQQAQGTTNSIAVGVQWMVVPRHPQRFEAVAALIEQQGFTVSRRRNWQDGPPVVDPLNTIWLGDSLGEIPMYYGLSDVALLGGSFEPLGGQNLIEAAACGCPVIMGPNTFNFLQAAELAQAAGAAIRVADLSEAVAKTGDLLGNPTDQATMTLAALGLSRTHRGALEKTVTAVTVLLDQQGVHGL
ncbi:3-deoxy-D-manno-octulosonic acid transferase [Rhodoferax sp. PAMC 29310]|uniref:3-deoxy-D-manno-octulosonic acid transferase n=1 Tax=Rhodoferax sp. PAMC 29310 TaxID=2822760 RepID=UPI001B332B0F|nr:3-deoxy-D-manno-octulosonic acid transferase [Rhodoferax sp. PAMC 29310]